ncbi:histidinol-phosphate aminotransferase [Gammaproteobacteria bacterium]
MIQVNANLTTISAYTTPWAGLERSNYLRLDLNENTQALPDHAIERMVRFIRQVGVQCYPDYAEFVAKLSSYCGVPADLVLVTNGSDQGIDVILRAFLAPGDEMVVARPEFAMFGNIAHLLDAKIAGVPYEDEFRFPYETFHGAVSPATRLIVIINPNNPTGTPVSLEYIEGLLQQFPEVPILVDEAYYEYTESTALDFLRRYDNLILLRTFSKAFAMAGLRLGYIIARSELIAHFEKIRGPFAVNSVAMEAAAAQLEHSEQMRAQVDEVMKLSKPFTRKFLAANGIKFIEGAANFFLVAMPDLDAMVAYLKSQGILVRPLRGPRLDGLVRMSFGTLAEMHRVEKVITAFLQGKNGI